MASSSALSKHRSVFIGNIPYQAEEKQLIQICEEIGPVVSFRPVMDRQTGKQKGFGFCEYLDEETALSACRNLQGYMVRGRQLRVNLANKGNNACYNKDQNLGDPGFQTKLDETPISYDPTPYQPHTVSSAMAVVLTTQSTLEEMQSCPAYQQGSDLLTNYLIMLSVYQLFDIISAIKFLGTHHKPVVRQYIQQNPILQRAQNQAETMLGIAPSATMQIPMVASDLGSAQNPAGATIPAASGPPSVSSALAAAPVASSVGGIKSQLLNEWNDLRVLDKSKRSGLEGATVDKSDMLPWNQMRISEQYQSSQLDQSKEPQQPVATVSLVMQPTPAAANWVAPQNLAPWAPILPQNEVSLERPRMPFQDITQFSYCTEFAVTTPVNLQPESSSEFQPPTKIRKLA